MEKKKYKVYWTGGLDSTALIIWLLEQGHTVMSSYITIRNNEAQTKRERNAIESMKVILEKNYENYIHGIKEHHTKVDIGIRENTSSPVSLQMVPIFILDMIYNGNEEWTTALGYVSGDDAISHIDTIQDIIKSYEPLTRYALSDDIGGMSNNINIEFPFIKISKEEVANYLKQKGEEQGFSYINNVTFCEHHLPEKNYCEECSSCKRMLPIAPFLFDDNVKDAESIDKQLDEVQTKLDSEDDTLLVPTDEQNKE